MISANANSIAKSVLALTLGLALIIVAAQSSLAQDALASGASTKRNAWAIVVDNSASIKNYFELIKVGANDLATSKNATDSIQLIRFVDKINLIVPETVDADTFKQGIKKLTLELGQTAILDGLYLSAESLIASKLCQEHPCSRVLLLMSDGEERLSYFTQKQVMKILKDGNIRVFSIGFVDSLEKKQRAKAEKFLRKLTTATLGAAYFPKTEQEMLAAIASIKEAVQ